MLRSLVGSEMCIRDRYAAEEELNSLLRHSRESLRTEGHDVPYFPSRYTVPFVHPLDRLHPGSLPTEEYLNLEANQDPRYRAWERVTQAPALKVEASRPSIGRVHERRRGAPLQFSHHPAVDPRTGHHNRHVVETTAPTDEGFAWAPNRVFFKQSHLGHTTHPSHPAGPVGGPSSSARADRMIVDEFERMEARFSERRHLGADLGCGAPPRVYPDAWSRDTPNWDTQHEERAHGIASDNSFWYAKDSQMPQGNTRLSPPRQRHRIVISDHPAIPLVCAQTGLPIVDESQAVIKCGVVPYIDQAAAKADWQRHQQEALYLNAYMDRFGCAVKYPDYISSQPKNRLGIISWVAHAQPSSHNPFLSVVPPQPGMSIATTIKCGQFRANAVVVAAGAGTDLVETSVGGHHLVQSLVPLPVVGEGVTALYVCDELVGVGNASGSVTLYTRDGSCLQLASHTGAVTDIHSCGDCVASSGLDGLVLVSNSQNGDLEATLEGHVEGVHTIRCFSSGVFCTADTVISGSSDGNIRVWDPSSEHCVDVLRNHAEAVFCMELVGDRLFSGAADGVRVWAVSQHKCILELPKCGDVRAIGVVGSAMAVASLRVSEMDVMLYDWETTQCVARLENLAAGPDMKFWIDMSVDKLVFTAHDHNPRNEDRMLVWDFGMGHSSLPSAAHNQLLVRQRD
eukprot:TRINITY_DN3232_c0_g1_i1.p1 TRINITY_DN3232_c0_g1~~TRINITY_DN3232_c0_g1_i1.p1  ORF type:complete len:681 (-),score=122.49 TRINITY_DN3232_c0_g1_i1:292-2334(-)